MEIIKINQKLNNNEINKYCLKNHLSLIMVSYKENQTSLLINKNE